MEKDTDGKIYNVYKRILKDGRKICLMIDAEKYYQKLISGIHIGTNGYIVVKDAEGTIIMHPKKEQWGIPVIGGQMKNVREYRKSVHILRFRSETASG